ncbi:MAG: hypothetical protein KC912_09150 [Proteobacteria bacterium]|nr:hypothetical protein [Pseudomonadota bacterium]
MRERVAVGASAFGLVVCLSYAVLRLLAVGEPGGAGTVHIPFFWRSALAGLHGLVAGLAAASAVRDSDAWLERVPLAVALVLSFCVTIAVVFP